MSCLKIVGLSSQTNMWIPPTCPKYPPNSRPHDIKNSQLGSSPQPDILCRILYCNELWVFACLQECQEELSWTGTRKQCTLACTYKRIRFVPSYIHVSILSCWQLSPKRFSPSQNILGSDDLWSEANISSRISLGASMQGLPRCTGKGCFPTFSAKFLHSYVLQQPGDENATSNHRVGLRTRGFHSICSSNVAVTTTVSSSATLVHSEAHSRT